MPSDAAQFVDRLKGRHPVAVGVLGGQGVIDLGDRDDPRDRRDLLAPQAIGIAAAVDALVMGAHDLRDRTVDTEVFEQLRAQRRMQIDRLPVILRQRAVALHHAIGQRKAPDVMQQPRGMRKLRVALAHPALQRDVTRERRDRRAMPRSATVATM